MPASRFECPRCQTVFVKDIGDAAFVECPSCGALALPAGDATEGALVGAMGGAAPPTNLRNRDALPSTEAEQPPVSDPGPGIPSDPNLGPGGPGIFSGLLDDGHDGGGIEISIPPAAMAAPVTAGGGSLSSSSSPSPSSSGSRGAELDFNLGDLDIDLPSFPSAPPPPPARPARAERAAAEARAERSDRPDRSDRAAPSDPFVTPAGGMSVNQLSPEALAALSDEADAGPTDARRSAPWSGLSEDAFGDLEKAFDEMALKPAAPVRGKGLSVDEERFLRGDSGENSGPVRPPPRRRPDAERSGRNAPPPPPRRGAKAQRPRPSHFELSDEAKTLAFLPLVKETSAPVVRPRLDARANVPAGPPVEVTEPSGRPAPGASGPEATDLVRPGRDRPAKKPVPSAWQGLSFGRVAVLVLFCAALGGVGGAFTTPEKAAPSTRARAELQFADGNKFYEEGRYDDALGKFRGALSIDPTFGLALRAKGAALAKLNRHDEALEAYEDYLKAEPQALDAEDVKAAITRRGPIPGREREKEQAPEPPPAPPPADATAPPAPAAPAAPGAAP